jgi:hypothetical protein
VATSEMVGVRHPLLELLGAHVALLSPPPSPLGPEDVVHIHHPGMRFGLPDEPLAWFADNDLDAVVSGSAGLSRGQVAACVEALRARVRRIGPEGTATLFNNRTLRLVDAYYAGDPARLHIVTGITNYLTSITTNHALRLVDPVRSAWAGAMPPSSLANQLGTQAVLRTGDGRLVIRRRGFNVEVAPGRLDASASGSTPATLAVSNAPLHAAAAMEVAEELGVELPESAFGLASLVVNADTLQPNSVLVVEVPMSFGDLCDAAERLGDGEHADGELLGIDISAEAGVAEIAGLLATGSWQPQSLAAVVLALDWCGAGAAVLAAVGEIMAPTAASNRAC